jgi:SAM-dependent methyltransferase
LTELLIGCGHSRVRQLGVTPGGAFSKLVTLDINPECAPDIVHDLGVLPYPFEADAFDEVHAYEVLEHVGRQGDWRFFFAQWSEFYRILCPGGHFFGTVPHHSSPWAWGDPSHTRAITLESLAFLDRRFYEQLGRTSASDFRAVWRGDFRILYQYVTDDKRQCFVLRKWPI